MLVNTSSLIAIQSYNTHQSVDRTGGGAERTAAPGVLSKTAQRGLREPFVLVDLSEAATAKLAKNSVPSEAKRDAAAREENPAETSPNKFLREAPKANAQPAISRPGTHLDISV